MSYKILKVGLIYPSKDVAIHRVGYMEDYSVIDKMNRE